MQFKTKRCTTCDKVKPVALFYRGTGKGGRHSQCSACKNTVKRRNRQRAVVTPIS